MDNITDNLTQWFGDNPKARVLKLTEEVQELKEAIEKGDFPDIVDEISDTALVLYHILSLYAMDFQTAVKNAYIKAENRRTNPEYMRTHPHLKKCEFCEQFQPVYKLDGIGICRRDKAKRTNVAICPYEPIHNGTCASCGNCKYNQANKCTGSKRRIKNNMPPCVLYAPDINKIYKNEN